MSRPWTAETVAAAPRLPAREPFLRLVWDAVRALSSDDPIANRHLLLLRFALANILALALVGAAAGQGWIGQLLAAEGSGYSVAIALVFAAGLIMSGHRVVQISQALNEIKRFERNCEPPLPPYLRLIQGRDGSSRALLASSLKLRLAARIAPVRHIANSLVLLGLTGTVIGFIVALSGVRPDAASDVGAIGPMISTLITGMAIALHTTLVGSLLHLWLMVNLRLLESGTIKLLTATVELGERHARS
ncbi:MAG TPA: MotA/TolQ/ExbB proton channel family protein [Geminicoccaceae bacterium]|nr:MotA/TolQ/ExbB proton channel family protein [Geminicoccaceae bacterium]